MAKYPRLIPQELLTKFTDEQWSTLWDNGALKDFDQLRPDVAAIPGVKEMYSTFL
jgi:hypothetical protein